VLFRLGKRLKVNYIIVDLRAGLSEMAAPLLFDPRVLRFLVTTYSSQSVEGMKLVLMQMAKVAPLKNEEELVGYHDPYLIFSMVPEELKDNDKFIAIQRELMDQYPDYGEDDATPARLTTINTFFAQQLLYLEGLEHTLSFLGHRFLRKPTGCYQLY